MPIVANQIGFLRGHNDYISSISFSPNGKFIVSIDSGDHPLLSRGRIKLWKVNKQELYKVQFEDRDSDHKVSSSHFSPDCSLLVTGGSDGTIRIWSVETGKELHRLVAHSKGITRVEFSPNGGFILSASYDRDAIIWGVTGEKQAVLSGHRRDRYGIIFDARFSPNGQLVATGSDDITVRLWTMTGKQMAVWETGGWDFPQGVRSLAFSPNGSLLAVGTEQAQIQIWKVREGKKISVLKYPYQLTDVSNIQFSPNGAYFAALCGHDLRIWSMEDIFDSDNEGQKIDIKSDYTIESSEVAFSPDSRILAIGAKFGGSAETRNRGIYLLEIR